MQGHGVIRIIVRRLVPFVATWAALALTIVGLCAAYVALDARGNRLDFITTFHYLREYRERGTCGSANNRCLPAAVAIVERKAAQFWPDVWATALPYLVAATAVAFAPPLIAAVYTATTKTQRAANERRQRRFTFAQSTQQGESDDTPSDTLPPLPPPPPGVRS